MDHLDKVSGAGRANMSHPLLRGGRERLKDRLKPSVSVPVPADHEAVALRQAPDAAAGSGIQHGDAARGDGGGAPLCFPIVGVPAVDDDIPWSKQLKHGVDGLLRGVSGGNHDPDGARCGQARDHVRQ